MIETPRIDDLFRTTGRPVIPRAGWPVGRAIEGPIASESLLRPADGKSGPSSLATCGRIAGMPQASYSVTIDRPVGDVFDFLADGERCVRWRPGVLDIKRTSGEGVGTRYTQGVKGPMGRRIAADYEVTVFEPGRRLEFQTVAGPVRPHGRYDLEPAEEGTRLTFALDAEVGGLRGVLMGSQVQKTMDAEVRNLDNLKALLEGARTA
jgi:carbon monoxide dehydrogenase subunit G